MIKRKKQWEWEIEQNKDDDVERRKPYGHTALLGQIQNAVPIPTHSSAYLNKSIQVGMLQLQATFFPMYGKRALIRICIDRVNIDD